MAAPKAPQAIPKRALSKQESGAPRPSRPGKMFDFGTRTLSKTNSPVAEARSDHLLCVSGVVKPSIPRSTMIPLIRPASFFAQTTATSQKGAFEIHILAPFSITSSPSSLKLVVIPPGFDPKLGSVNPKEPKNSPVASFGKNFRFCASEPYAYIGNMTNEL